MLQNYRQAVRSLLKTPGFTLVVILILAVGIGANTVLFTLVHSVLLKPLPFPDPDRLVMIWDTNSELAKDKEGPTPANVLDWRERNRVFSGIGAWREDSAALVGEGDAEQIQIARVTSDFFPVLGRKAAQGRTFLPEEVDRQDHVVVLSHGLFQRRFGGDPKVIGSSIEMGGESWRVIGVMPADFAFPAPRVELWKPWDFKLGYANRPGGPPRTFHFLQTVARLKPGVSPEQAAADLSAIAARLAEEHPEENKGWGVRVASLHEETVGSWRRAILVLFAAVAFVLLIACTNIAALLLVRMLGRQHETSVRLALGASRGRLLAQLLAESVVLGIAGGLLGVFFSVFGLKLLLLLQPGDLPRVEEIGIDGSVLGFTLLVSLAVGLVVGLIPALQGSRPDLAGALKAGGGRTSSAGRFPQMLRRMLAVAEVAIAVILLVGAGLLARSFQRLQAVDLGFDSDHLLVVRVMLNTNSYESEEARVYYQTLTERLAALPGIRSAGAVTALPMSPVGEDFDRPYWLEGNRPPEGKEPEAGIRIATPGYIETLGIKLLRGRSFTAQDRADSVPVVLVNETLARSLWPGKEAVGQQLVVDYRGVYSYQVAGVVHDTRFYGLRSEPKPEIFVPHAQIPYLPMNVVARTVNDPRAHVEEVRRLAREIDPAQPLHSVVTMEELVADSVAQDRFTTSLLIFLAGVALLLAALGIYGLLAYSVRQRSHEISVRMALGARRESLLRSVLGESLKLTLVGTAIGIVLALGLNRLLASLLFGVTATDPATFVGVGLLLLVTAALAGYLPARRATRVDPLAVLRQG
ncbi:MAG TPA: ABC transporter permease [Thermoanaerobaculia bacterium]|nr:ABC transporter permease [Thermoanaerobaculia bacterium]